jgi:cation-transporting P-type ATPase 13A2
MSVFAKNYVTNQYTLFVKGSPEKMKELSKPGTVPANFDSILNQYTQKGYRVLGLAYRDINMTYPEL